ncbi:MAG: hypothetical protein FWG99_07910 [Treponema sp.]|nr:hypothetical protein [Treponema sp.]
MNRIFIIVALLAISFFTFSCAISKAIYLGRNDHSSRTGSPLSTEFTKAENINGIFPEAVHIKTRTQTFNTYHYYILNDGLIWYKSIDSQQEPKDWTLFMKTGLPHARKRGFIKPTAITEISADADELAALSSDGFLYSYCFDKTLALRSNGWLDKQGWPEAGYFYFDRRTAANRSWALGKRNSHVLYYEDIFGNQHHNGSMEIATFYVLLENGQEICYGDPGLPSDFSRNFIGPERGTFKAIALSASASTMFLVNEAGEMYTRLADFDTIGCDPMFFKYTYIPYASDLSGTDYFSNLNEWGLPSEDWRSQPRIPLDGKAAVTRHITILQNGQGNGSRELRVAGLDEDGNTGYWYKPIFDDSWEFKTAPLYIDETVLITAENSGTTIQGERGLSLDKYYAGFQWNDNEKENNWEYQIPNFNILEGDCDLIITWQGETCIFKLHPLEMWTYLKRDYLPGRTGSPKMFNVTLEIPDDAFDSLSDAFIRLLTERYMKNNKKLYHYTIAATDSYIIMRDTDNINSLLFLTVENISNQYSELLIGQYIDNFEEVQRFYSPELTLKRDSDITLDELNRKLALNRQYMEELKYKIRVLKWSQLTVFKFNAGYIPAHYIVKISPLRFVDVPKIRTVTSYGKELILANSAYINSTANSRIWLYEKIIELLETRIICYNDLLVTQNNITLPAWYSERISDYWDIAGLPRTISGTFSYLDITFKNMEIPAHLSFVPLQTEHDISGWFLAISDSTDFSVFFAPRNISKIIYSRKGKTPQERRLSLRGTLYINNAANSPVEGYILESFLRPYQKSYMKAYSKEKGEGIEVRITFDGRTFEIREYPIRRDRPPIFTGA